MRARLSMTVILAASAALAAATMAQGESSGSASASASQSATQLQREMDAMNTMNETIGPMVDDATDRIKLMKEFISSQNLDDAWASFSASGSGPSFDGLTFNQAFQSALKHQDLAGTPTPSTSNMDQLQRELTATQTLVQKAWNRLNSRHDQVAKLDAFLSKQGKDKAYHEWVQNEKAEDTKKRAAERAERNKPLTAEQRATKAQAYMAHQDALRQHWDKQLFANRGSNANQRRAPGSEEGPPINSDSYYNGSYYNGYADPYYDVYGYGGYDDGRRRGVGDHIHNWDRAHGPGSGTGRPSSAQALSEC